MSTLWLSDDEILDATRRRQPARQAKVLADMRVPFQRRPDGTLLVGRAASHYLPKIEWLFEQMEEKAWDEAGEHAEDWPGSGLTDEGCKALEAGIKALVDQHVRVHFYTVANVQRIELTAEMIVAALGVVVDRGETFSRPDADGGKHG